MATTVPTASVFALSFSQNLPLLEQRQKDLTSAILVSVIPTFLCHASKSSENYIPYNVNDYTMRNPDSQSLLTAVFHGSGSRPAASGAENSSPMITQTRERVNSTSSVFYDDFDSSNINVLSVSPTAVGETSLLDSDPFADLSTPPVASPSAEQPATPLVAPLYPPFLRHRASYTIPASMKRPFKNSPSMPSLSTLAHINVQIPHKVRRGKVGATLPFEPWDLFPDENNNSILSSPASHSSQLAMHSSSEPSSTSSTQYFSSSEEEDYGEQCSSTLNIRVWSEFDHSDSAPDGHSSILPGCHYKPPADFKLASVREDDSNFSSSSSSDHSYESLESSDNSHSSSSWELNEEDFYSECAIPPAPHLSLDWSIGDQAISNPLATDGSEPGSSASTVRASPLEVTTFSSISSPPSYTRRRSAITAAMWIKGRTIPMEEPAVDGDAYQRGSTGTGSSGSNNGGQRGRTYGYGGYGGTSSGGYGSGGSGADDGDGSRRNRRLPPSFVAFSEDSEEEEEEEEEASEDDYGYPSSRHPLAQSNSSDDDVPLAQSIPTALKAQQSIRMKDREARAQRRKERETRAAARAQQAALRSPPIFSSSQEAALQASKSLRRPVKTAAHSAPLDTFPIDDLTKKLENVQRNPRSAPISTDGTSWPDEPSLREAASNTRTLGHMRSFHKPEPRKSMDDKNAHPLPTNSAGLARSNTRARARSTASRENPRSPPLPTSVDDLGQLPDGKRSVKKTAEGTKAATQSAIEHARPPLPAPAELIARQNNVKVALSQQRVFIGDRQRFVVVEISPSTTAGEVVRMVEAQGALKEWRGSGGWMLFEIAQDFGMERPIRNFELLSDVEASWNKDKLVNVFLLKLTSLAPILSRSALPSSSPTHSGYLEWESKRGKWNKRYLMLKEHCLWLSKRDNGRDEVMLCSLSNFDAYQITRLVKAPKEFTFAVKSTDNLSFFENTADYLHVFSCKTDSGEKWMEKILLARSYVLYQERHVLFKSPKSAPLPSSPPPVGSTGLSRSLTKKPATSQQPLVNVHSGSVFEPGSLLHG